MRKANLILMVMTLLFLMSTVHLFSQDSSGNTCVVTINSGGTTEKPSYIAYIDNGSAKIEVVKFSSFAKFIEEMKSKGWNFVQPVSDSHYIYLFFEKKK